MVISLVNLEARFPFFFISIHKQLTIIIFTARLYMFQPSPFGKYLCEYRAEMLHPLFCLAAVGTCLSAGPSDRTSINSFQRATCPAPSLLSHQSIVTLQIVSQGALWAVGDEEEGGSDKSVALNCYRFSGLNLFFFFSSSGRLRVQAEVQRCHAAVIQSDICRNPSSFSPLIVQFVGN